jgi:hypothetical protein
MFSVGLESSWDRGEDWYLFSTTSGWILQYKVVQNKISESANLGC